MNCTQCGYLLFGLPQCRCPECGTPFSTTDYGFPVGGVHFLCPYCQQSYLGTDEFGLPRPRNFACIKCHRPITAATMQVRPVREGVLGESLRYGTPWDHRDRIGAGRAFVESITQIATQPTEFFRTAYLGDVSAAVAFCMFVTAPTVALLILALGFITPIGPVRGFGLAAEPFSFNWFLQLFVAVAALCGAAVVWAFAYAIGIAIVLRLMGRAKATVEAAVQLVCYAQAVLPAIILPPVGMLWYTAVVTAGIAEWQEMSWGRALVAAALPLLAAANALILMAML